MGTECFKKLPTLSVANPTEEKAAVKRTKLQAEVIHRKSAGIGPNRTSRGIVAGGTAKIEVSFGCRI